MKYLKLTVLSLTMIMILSACFPPPPVATVKPNSQAKNEIIMTNELKALLADTPRPKLVIRVSNPPTNVTEAEKFNAYINMIEKGLMQNGFTVRDRALLENLMRSGNADYQTISQKIDTDIIIDILSLQFDIPNRFTTYYNDTTKQNETFLYPDNYVDCPLAKLEVRLTIVNKGQLGGMFTFFCSRCDVQDLKFWVNRQAGVMNWLDNPPPPQPYRSLAAPIDSEEIKTYFVGYFAQALINQLQEGINLRIKTAADLYNAGNFAEAQGIVTELIKKDPHNLLLLGFQALLYAQAGNSAGAQQQLDTAMMYAAVPYQRAIVYWASARVNALKGEKELALSLLRKSLENGLGGMMTFAEIRATKDLANIAGLPEFDTLLNEFEKPAPKKDTK